MFISKADLNHCCAVKVLLHMLNKTYKARKINIQSISGDKEKLNIISRQVETSKSNYNIINSRTPQLILVKAYILCLKHPHPHFSLDFIIY